MRFLACKVTKRPYYRGETAEDDFNPYDSWAFINFDGYCFMYLTGGLIEKHHETIDALLLVDHTDGVLVGFYEKPVLFRDLQYFDPDCPFHVLAKAENAVLLPIEQRQMPVNMDKDIEWVPAERRFVNALKQTRRLNYRLSDFNKTMPLKLPDLKTASTYIETMITRNELLKALYAVNQALAMFGKKPALYYYKAWILYSFLQYQDAATILYAIKDIPALADHCRYMLGNIYFETGEYALAISYFKQVKQHEKAQTSYMLAQSWAMLKDAGKAQEYINQALRINPEEAAYQDFADQLRRWQS